jgi:hypothetical protein
MFAILSPIEKFGVYLIVGPNIMANIEDLRPDVILDEAERSAEGQRESEAKREQSTISFPYHDLDDAIGVAKGVHMVGGTSCENAQLAAQLQSTIVSGGFRLRLLAAKLFGLVTYSQGRVTLTRLGEQICDSKQEKAARKDAFLSVPLYRQVYTRFRHGALPPNPGLEAEITTMGVIEKQAGKARQVLQRSAGQAGFFWSGQDRLVMPPVDGRAEAPPEEKKPPESEKHKGGGRGDGGGRHQLIMGLIDALPPEKTDWPVEDRKEWLEGAAAIFNLIYKNPSKGTISIELRDR